jgi:hypothetical protein
LRQAILDANANPGQDIINFSINGAGGVQTITPSILLPVITDPVAIDATTQSGWAVGHPVIQIDGSQAGSCSGLEIHVGNCTVKGLIINSFAFDGILLIELGNSQPTGNNFIQGNFLGTDASGTAAKGNKDGLDIIDSPGNLIGGLDPAQRNLISGNRVDGIDVDDQLSSGNIVEGNYIGTDASGLKPLGNQLDGVFLARVITPVLGTGFASSNDIGGIDPKARNVISGNGHNGVHILQGSSNNVQANYIGLGADGVTPVSNGQADVTHGNGVLIEDASQNVIGGTDDNAGNVISANRQNGIEILASSQSATGNFVQGNFIGTDASGATSDPDGTPISGDELGNLQNGLLLRNDGSGKSLVVAANVIGGADADDGAVDGAVKARNVISGNFNDGILFVGSGVTTNVVLGNFIGLDKQGEHAIPNIEMGILLNSFAGESVGPSGNVIGGANAGAGNVISGNGLSVKGVDEPSIAADGVHIAGNSNTNFVLGNLIGTDAEGLQPVGNVGNGVVIENSTGNFIGGGADGAGNTISGNSRDGVVIDGSNATANMIQKNRIGVGSDSVAPLPNQNGIHITQAAGNGSPSGNVIGGSQVVGGQEVSLGNTIAANRENGVDIDSGATKNLIVGNLIGKTPFALEGNAFNGVAIFDSPSNTIGGLTDAQRNSMVDNGTDGVLIKGLASTLNVVIGNYIGLGLDGLTPEGNVGDGVEIDNAPANIVGQLGTNVRGNEISGNTGSGVHITGKNATLNQVAINFIGTDASGKVAVGNAVGISITDGASLNTLDTDLVSGNKLDGIDIQESVSNNIRDCRIGTDRLGTGAVPNLANGVLLRDAFNTVVGGDGYDDSASMGGNLISGNKQTGVLITGSLTTATVIKGNHIGISLDSDANKPLGNGLAGVAIINDPVFGAPSQLAVAGNVLAGNLASGIRLDGVTSIHITGNFIGTNASLISTSPNIGFGIVIKDSFKNSIGGAADGEENTIYYTAQATVQDPSVGSGVGVFITGTAAKSNQVVGNFINKNTGEGIALAGGASGNVIGGTTKGAGNIVAGNLEGGILITDVGTSGNTILGDFVGVAQDGTPAGNVGSGVGLVAGASNNIIGGDSPEAGNVISANTAHGIFIGTGAHNNWIQGNLIGTDPSGAFKEGFGNKNAGVDISSASKNTIGGEADVPGNAPGNTILGNGVGVAMDNAAAQQNLVVGNEIGNSQGFVVEDTTEKGNGIIIVNGASNNLIGGSKNSDANSIHDNSGAGVFVDSGTGNRINRNQIFDNSGLAIDLAPEGPTLNDAREAKDSDAGANNLQNYPFLNFATTGGSSRIAGSLESAQQTSYEIEFFVGAKNEEGKDDAEKFVTRTTVTTNASGVGLFDIPLPDGQTAGTFLIATATDPKGNTSEFSNSIEIETDTDGDAIGDLTENDGPHGGDGNQDGKPDSQQPEVVTIPDAVSNNSFITLVAPAGKAIQNARSVENPSPDDAPLHTQFGLGFYDFNIVDLEPGEHLTVQMILPVTVSAPNSYWRYGKTPDTPTVHWYLWMYDPKTDTGAQINGHVITLHFVDGARGDDDLTANGTIVDPGAPGFADPFTVTNTADSGPGSLRQAILNANANPGVDVITFDIQASGPLSIKPLSALPTISDPVTIDGSTQPGFNGAPLIELDGSQAGAGVDGLTLAAGSSTIRSLAIIRFARDGLHLEGDGSDDIEGNVIGTDAAGMPVLGNDGFGIEIDNSGSNSIGSSQNNGGNVIAGNHLGGVFIHGQNATNNSLRHNSIGALANGVTSLGNGGPGVLLDGGASANRLGTGAAADANIIAFNAGAGVSVLQANQTDIEVNSIFANGGLGIDLGGDGVTANDDGDGDSGSNDLQNFPNLTHVASYGGRVYISGTLSSTPGSSFLLSFYGSAAADPSGFGEGQSFLGSNSVTTDATGQTTFSFSFATAVAPGSFLSATATSQAHATSEFSAVQQVPASSSLVFTVNTTDDLNDAVPDPTHLSLREAILQANQHPGADIIRFNLPDGSRTLAPLSALPDITDPVTIDGSSEPGFAGLPLIDVDGSHAGGADGLHITGGGSVIRDLVINRFQFDSNSGAGGSGIELDGLGGNLIEGCFLGTDVTGTTVLSNQFAGVRVNDSPNNIIGGVTAAARNVINGVYVNGSGATGNTLEGNYVATDLTGTALLLSTTTFSGVTIDGAPLNTIGGLGPGAENIIAAGLKIFGAGNLVEGNLIGTDVTGTVFLTRGDTSFTPGGVLLDGGANANTIGGTVAGARNIIPGGITLGGTANFNLIQGNLIGTDITGTKALSYIVNSSSMSNGISISGNGNTIGGTDPGAGNLISGNVSAGIFVAAFARNNVIQGNLIGTDVTGEKPLGNLIGITSFGSNTTIGGAAPGAGNVISGNSQYGVNLVGRGNNFVKGNLIGTDRTGTKPLGNGVANSVNDGIFVGESGDIIGGVEPGAGNVISGNGGNGISLGVSGTFSSNISIQGNFIGTDRTGTLAIGNGAAGIQIYASHGNLIGGTLPGAGNVISANNGAGILIFDVNGATENGQTSTGNLVEGNRIGTDVTGAKNLGNAQDGVSIMTSSHTAANNIIGGTDSGAGNVIAFNGGNGASNLFGSGRTIRENSIFANGGFGIITDINGVLSSYAEARSANLIANIPVITQAVFDSQGTVVDGTLAGSPFTTYNIDLFASDALDPSGFGEGQTFLETIKVFTDETGTAQLHDRLEMAVPVGQYITATATDPAGNTSPFSQAFPILAKGPDSIQFTAPAYLVTEDGVAGVVVVIRTGSSVGQATVDYATADGSATAGADYTAVSGTLTFADGETRKTLTIPIQDDAIAEGAESFRLSLSNPVGANLGGVHDAVVTNADDDGAGQLNFSTSALQTPEGKEVTLIVTRTDGTHGRVTADYRVTGGTATPFISGSSDNTDYEDVYGSVTLEDGQTTAMIFVTTYDDYYSPSGPVFEGHETVDVTLGNPSGGATLGPVNETELTITDDDDLAGGFETGPTVDVFESDGQVQIQVIRSGRTDAFQSVSYATLDGTAKAGVNYQSRSGTLQFQPGDRAESITIPILDDRQVGNPGNFQLTLSNPTGGAILDAGQETSTITIHDSDFAGRFVATSTDTDENAGSVQVEIARKDASRGKVQVDYATSDGTALAGADYMATSGTVTFNDGETSKTISVPILPDNKIEGDETFFVNLSNPTGGAMVDNTNPGVVTIFEAPGQIQFSATSYRVAENNASFTVTVVYTPAANAPFAPVTVDYTIHDGTATAGADYIASSGTLTFDPTFNRKTITIPILDDALVEPDETMLLTLSNATGGPSIGAQGNAALTILDDDSTRAGITLTAQGVPASSFERSVFTGTVAAFTYSAAGVQAGDFSASINWGDGSSSAGQIAASGSGSFKVAGSHTYQDEGHFTVQISISDHRGNSAQAQSAMVTLEELLPDGTRGTPNQRFISELYRDLLGRQVDPAGLAFWNGLLASGLSHAQIALGVMTATPEFHTGLVQEMYQLYLHRVADPQGLRDSVAFLNSGGTRAELAVRFVSSPEYYQVRAQNANGGFLDALFQDAFDRSIETSAQKSLADQLASGATRSAVADVIFASAEYQVDVVRSIYLRYLDRELELKGLAIWTALEKSGVLDDALLSRILGETDNNEFYNKTAP